MAENVDLAFRLTANATGMNAGIAQAEKSLQRVGAAARTTSRDFRDAARITAQVRTPTERYAQTVQRLDDLMEKGLITQDVYTRAVEQADEKLRDAEKGVKGMEESTDNAVKAIDRMTAALMGTARSIVENVSQSAAFQALTGTIMTAASTYLAFRGVLTKPMPGGGDTLLTLASQFSKTIVAIQAATFALEAVGIETGNAASFATQSVSAFTAFRAAAAFGFTADYALEYGKEVARTYQVVDRLRTGMTAMGVAAETQNAIFATGNRYLTNFAGTLTHLATVPLPQFVSVALTAYAAVRVMAAMRESMMETGREIQELTLQGARMGETFQDLHVQKLLDAGTAREDILRLGEAISAIDVAAYSAYAESADRNAKAGERFSAVLGNIGRAIGSPLLGFFTAANDGLAKLTSGFTDLGIGILSLAQPIGQALRPFGTLMGTVVESVLRLAGGVASAVGTVLRLAGALTSVVAAPIITGFNTFADAIRTGVGAAFDWFGARIEWVQQRLDGFFEALSRIPLLGRAFGSARGGVAGANAAGGAARAALPGDEPVADASARMAEAAAIEQEFLDSISGAMDRQTNALSGSIDRAMEYGDVGFDAAKKYQDGLASLNDQLMRGAINETVYGREADKLKKAFDEQLDAVDRLAEGRRKLAEQDAAEEAGNVAAITKATDAYFEATKAAEKYGADGAAAAAEYEGGLTALQQKLNDGAMNERTFADEAEKLRDKFREQIDVVKATADAQRRRADDIVKMNERIADAGEFQREAKATLAKPTGEALQVADIRSSEGIASFMALASGREDPAVAEYRKSHETLKQMLAELKALQQAPLEIAGAAGGG
jgi:hypothetical protein